MPEDPVEVAYTTEGKHFTHKVLWAIAQRQFENAVARPSGSLHDYLVAMIFALHSLEAYLNYVGDSLAPHIWKNEREFFSKMPYRGFMGKLLKVQQLCGICEPDPETRPYSSIVNLKYLRDLIAHGKVQHISATIAKGEPEPAPFSKVEIYNLASEKNALEAIEDVEAFCCRLHEKAKPKLFGSSAREWFGDSPFGGARGYAERNYTDQCE